MSKQATKAVYCIRNWRQYNEALVRRGALTVWVDRQSLDAWNWGLSSNGTENRRKPQERRGAR